MIFHDLTLSADGTVRSRRTHDTDKLVPDAVSVFGLMLLTHGRSFKAPIPHDDFAHIVLSFTQEDDGAALATFFVSGELATTSVLMTGKNERGGEKALLLLQQALSRAMRRGGVEAGFELVAIPERPVIVTIPWPNPAVRQADMMFVADMETCLMAAWLLEEEAE
jgi:hypothetical protein